MSEISTGECALCKGTFSKASMTRHIQACRIERAEAPPLDPPRLPARKAFHLVVEGDYSKDYWMHLEAPAHATLSDLDRFLRDIWLECCGHLSAFTIQGTTYVAGGSEEGVLDAESTDVSLARVLKKGTKFHYEYDFGSTTRLVLKVASNVEVKPGPKSIRLLARNAPPTILCNSCGKPATHVCCECSGGWLCGDCAHGHECGEDMLLPVVNSPRVGVCGYSG